MAGPKRLPFSIVSTIHEDEMYKTRTAKSELFTIKRREETHPYSEGEETEDFQSDKAGVEAFVLGAGLEVTQCSWSETFSCGPVHPPAPNHALCPILRHIYVQIPAVVAMRAHIIAGDQGWCEMKRGSSNSIF